MKKLLKTQRNIELTKEESNIYGNVDGLSLQNLFYTRHGFFPGCIMFDYDERTDGDTYIDTEKVIKYLIERYDKNGLQIIPYVTEKICNSDVDNDDTQYSLNFVISEFDIYGRVERLATESYIMFPNDKIELALKLADDIKNFIKTNNSYLDTYWRVASSNGGYYLTKGKIKCPPDISIEKIYNNDFIKEENKIQKFIEEKDANGLVILHGEKGTGKSTYIKYLIHSNPTKKFVYIPSNLVSSLSEPSFGSFLSTLNNHIIVVEDCENVIQDRRQSGSASSVSLLLNMTDGILSDDLGIKFICTFNEDIKNIDPALLRRGRLIAKYEFKKLCVEKTNVLLEELGHECTTKPMSLADIFYYDSDSYETIKTNII